MANIRVDSPISIFDGQALTFRSPADCSQITGLKVYYPEGGTTISKVFRFADAHGNNIGDLDLFAADVVVKVILDTDTDLAFVQNADTNAYLEGRFDGKADAIHTHAISDVTNLQTALNSKASTATYTATVTVTWTADGDYFYQDIAVSGITAGDNPVVDVVSGSDNEANALYGECICKVFRITTSKNSIRVWVTEAIETAFPIQLKVVR